jgi:hypothetical protein
VRLRILGPPALALAVALGWTGCGSTGHGSHARASTAAAITPSGRQIGRLSTPGTPKGEQITHIQVIATAKVPRAAMALVPVYIDAQGPFPFAVDTGASRSLISGRLARQIGLPQAGPAGRVSGITGSAQAFPVRISSWSAGSIPLPPTQIAAMSPQSESAEGQPPPALRRRMVQAPVGLLGSDVLSRFGKVAIDYDRSLLILDPPVR